MTQVSQIEYLNVRIRHFHSRLFSRGTYEELLSGDNLGTLTTFLLDHTEYGPDVEKALGNLPEREGLERGVTDHFARNISNTLNMAGGEPRRLFENALFSFDIKNIKTVLIARARGIPMKKARDMLIPCGSIPESKLADLLGSEDMDDVFYFLSRYFPFGTDVLKVALDQKNEGAHFLRLLNRLEKTAYVGILNLLDKTDQDMKILRNIFRLEIDMKNIGTAMKSVWKGEKPEIINEDTFIPGGYINKQFLLEITEVRELDEALEMIESTQFHPAVEKGIIYFAETGFLHEMERFFEEVFIKKILSFRRFNPFGIGIFIGYVWGRYVEMTNLRTIINGIAFRLGAAQIRKGLIYV